MKELVHCFECGAPLMVEAPEDDGSTCEWLANGWPVASSSNPRFWFCGPCVSEAQKEQAERKERKKRNKRRRARRRGR